MIASLAVSVVLCTRDGRSKGYLDAAMRSVLDQSPPAAEVIVVDDASTDGTAEYVERTYPQVRVIANARSGLAAGRNTGIAAARGQWIALMDDDDRWRYGKLAGQLGQIAASERPEGTIWASRMAWIDSAGRTTVPDVPLDHVASWPAILLGSAVSPSGAILARSLCDRIGPFAEHLRIGSGYDYWLRCLSEGVTVRLSDIVLTEHRRHGAQMTERPRMVDLLLAVDAIVLPYFAKLPAAQADRLRTARALMGLRSALARAGPRLAAHYWEATPLRQGRMDWRAAVYPLLDAAARPLPRRLQDQLRDFAVRTVA